MQKKIVWESKHYEFNPEIGRIHQEDKKEEIEQPIFIPESEVEVPIQRLMQTPFGIWSLDDSMNPFRQFKFWMGHTNFSIGPNAETILRRVPGIEVLKLITRYRFIIGVGQLFNIRDVRIYINKVLCGTTDVTIEEN